MSFILEKLKPAYGFSRILHIFLNVLLPVILILLIRLNFEQLAFVLVILSKWRTLDIKPRFWIANIRSNSVDIIFGLSMVVFIIQSANIYYQLGWVAIYIVWLLFIKPSSDLLIVSLQSFIAQIVGLSAVYLIWVNGSLYLLTFLTGLICYLVARHFFDNYEEQYAKLLSYTWAYIGASLSWILNHWLIYYKVISQPVLILGIIGYGLSMMYYLDHIGKLKTLYRREIIVSLSLILGIIVLFTNWGSKII